MASTYLDDIVAFHRARAAVDERDWRERLTHVRYEGPSMLDALGLDSGRVKVIAEVKRRSPSKGWINEDLDPATTARAYQGGGASAISVLTDEKFFSGSVHDLELVRASVELPILRKDFAVCANDVIDTAQMGASTVLLIVAALSDEEIGLLLEVAHASQLSALVEVHDQEDLARALAHDVSFIGVNQRDLRTFGVDTAQAEAMVKLLPQGVISVAESGFSSAREVARAGEVGFDAVLVGETFVRSSDPSALVREFASQTRRPRG